VKLLLKTLKVVALLYVGLLILLYFFQERVIFFPQKLNRDAAFEFDQPCQEMFFTMKDGTSLNGLLFKSDSSKGLIFYLHGNAGSLATWGHVAATYRPLHYDVFMLDYPGYGKSSGHISSEKGLHTYIQQVYDSMRHRYAEQDIVVLGYSIGTGLAARLAAENHPGRLILQAPYYSLVHMMQSNYPYLPSFILKYRLETNKYLPRCTMPVAIFHGDEDEIIPYSNALKLKPLLKRSDTLITLKGQRHNGMSDHAEYFGALKVLLSK
jgi:pimeloyl-ACP methyl ester carboxylesterase